MRKFPLSLLAALMLLSLMLGACGGDDGAEAPDAGGDQTAAPMEVSVSAVDNSFSPSDISGPVGTEVTVEFTNDGKNPHTFSSEDLGLDTGTIDPGGTASVSFTIPEAEVTFQCDIHGSSGMTGTVTPS